MLNSPSIGYIDEAHDHGVAEGRRARRARPGPSSIVGDVDQWGQDGADADDENTVPGGAKLWRGNVVGGGPIGRRERQRLPLPGAPAVVGHVEPGGSLSIGDAGGKPGGGVTEADPVLVPSKGQSAGRRRAGEGER